MIKKTLMKMVCLIKKRFIRYSILSIPYLIINFMICMLVLNLLQLFATPRNCLFTGVLVAGFTVWGYVDSVKETMVMFLGFSAVLWLIFLALAFIFGIPLIGMGCMVIVSLWTSIQMVKGYNQERWESRQEKYLM